VEIPLREMFSEIQQVKNFSFVSDSGRTCSTNIKAPFRKQRTYTVAGKSFLNSLMRCIGIHCYNLIIYKNCYCE
jgi:hypothetical protein